MLLLNRANVNTATTGTGTVTLGTAITSFLTWANAGASNNRAYRYMITDGLDWELGWGVYSSAGPTLTRNLVASSTGALLNLSGTATVACVAAAADMATAWKVPNIGTAKYLCGDCICFATGTVAAAANAINVYPLSRRVRTDGIAIEVTTAAAQNVRAGLYSQHPVTGLPHLLIEEGTPQSTGTTGIKVVTFAATREIDEPCFIATLFSGAVTCRTIGNSLGNQIGSGVLNFAGVSVRLSSALAYGALPADVSALTWADSNTGYVQAALRVVA